jgi:hypothetical protein
MSAPNVASEVVVPEKKKRRIFLWVFLSVQVLFLIWVISGAASGSGNTSDAENAGTAIGVALIIGFWAVVDIIMGVTYGVYRLAKRP